MSYALRVSDDGNYILLEIQGDINRQLAMQYNLAAHALGQKLGIARFLMDVTASRNVESITSKYVFAYDDMKNAPGINRMARVAVLVSPDDHSHDFIITVAQNSGLNSTLFRDREAAIEYLLKD